MLGARYPDAVKKQLGLQARGTTGMAVEGELRARWPHWFPEEAFSWDALRWAHAVFWSRAIELELPGGREAALVPLLDMCAATPPPAPARTLPSPARTCPRKLAPHVPTAARLQRALHGVAPALIPLGRVARR